MPSLAASGCELHYQIHDLTAPWIEDKQTILFTIPLPTAPGTYVLNNVLPNFVNAWDQVALTFSTIGKLDFRAGGEWHVTMQAPDA